MQMTNQIAINFSNCFSITNQVQIYYCFRNLSQLFPQLLELLLKSSPSHRWAAFSLGSPAHHCDNFCFASGLSLSFFGKSALFWYQLHLTQTQVLPERQPFLVTLNPFLNIHLVCVLENLSFNTIHYFLHKLAPTHAVQHPIFTDAVAKLA